MVPSARMAQTLSCPTEIDVAGWPSWTGWRLSPISLGWSPILFELPVPRRPRYPRPQHLTSPLSSSAQVKASPESIIVAVRLLPRSTQSAEPKRCVVVSPRPSWP